MRGREGEMVKRSTNTHEGGTGEGQGGERELRWLGVSRIKHTPEHTQNRQRT